MAKRLINFRLTLEEDEILREYARKTERNKTDIVRELIRSLKSRIAEQGVKPNAG